MLLKGLFLAFIALAVPAPKKGDAPSGKDRSERRKD
jgi:hypothetical protein